MNMWHIRVMEKENIDVFLDEEGNNANDIRLGHQKGDRSAIDVDAQRLTYLPWHEKHQWTAVTNLSERFLMEAR